MKKYVFGPVPSRRLGYSLGVDIIPHKLCTFDCIYCQIGKTTNKDNKRRSFFNQEDIVAETLEVIEETKNIDYISFSGSGEPTLNSDLGFIINKLKENTEIPVAVITNGSLLYQEEVRLDLLSADLIMPSLDAASDDIYRYINRPHSTIPLSAIIEGLKSFRRQFSGKIWLEIMLIKNINDSREELDKIKDVINYLEVDKVQLNTISRPPSEEALDFFEASELEGIRAFFGESCEIIGSFKKNSISIKRDGWIDAILDVLRRRSLSLVDIVNLTGVSSSEATDELAKLEKDGLLRSYRFGNDIFYMNKQ